MLQRAIPLAVISSARGMSTISVIERTHSCTDGVRLATRHWTNFDVVGSDDSNEGGDGAGTQRRRRRPRRRTRKILCLHGWLDNAASFERFAPALLESLSSSSSSSSDDDDAAAGVVDSKSGAIPTEIVALDFPGHGLSGHKSVDGPPQLLAEYAYYVAELVEALQWGDENGGDDVGAGGSASTNDGSDNEGSGRQMTGSSFSDDDCAADNDSNSNHNNKIILVGHSMGSGVAVVLCAAFPEWFSALVLLEGGLVARNADDASRHVRAACQRRLRSNRTLFPNANVGGGNASPSRARVYGNLDAAIRARLSTTERMPGDQSLSYEAARDMVLRATVPAPAAASTSRSDDEDGPVVFRHDPRLQWPSLQYYTREQVEAFMRDVRSSDVPVCSLWATDGWPVDAWAEAAVKDALRPSRERRLGGSHHFHADPDTVGAVAGEVFAFLTERKL